MPKYKITAPDGKAYVVTAPDGATQDQVLAYAQQHYAQQAPEKVITEPTVTVKAPDRLPGMLGDLNDFGNDFGDAVAHHLGNAAVGVGQLVTHGVVDRANALAPSGGMEPDTGIGSKLRNLARRERDALDAAKTGVDKYAANREANYQATVPDSVGSYIGAGLGEVLPWVVGAGEAKAVSTAPRVESLLSRLGRSSIAGSGLGATQPVTSGDYGKEKALQATIGAVAAPFAEGATAGGKGILSALRKPGVNPLDRAAIDILTREAENPAALAKAAPSKVPGVRRTLAEETLDPGIARLERNLRSTTNQFDAIDRSNNAARVSQLEKIAGSDSDMAAALEHRDTTTGTLRDAAFQQGEEFDAAEAAQQAADRSSHAAKVRQIEQENATRRSLGLRAQDPIPEPPAAASPKDALQSRIGEVIAKNNGNPAVQTALAVVGGALRQADDSVPGLYNVRKYVGDLLSGRASGDNVSAKAASRELIDIREAIDQELQRRAPSFSKYLTAFQDASKPINRMDVGRELMDRSSGSAILDPVTGSQVLTPAQFSKKARDLDAVAAKATGFKKAKATDILSASDIASIKAVQDDLERQAFRATAGSGGNSQTFERQAVQARLTKGAGREALRHVPVLGRYAGDFLDMIDKSRNERVKERLAYLVANPAEARRVLSSLPPAGQKVVHNALLSLGAPVSRIASTSGSQQPSQ